MWETPSTRLAWRASDNGLKSFSEGLVWCLWHFVWMLNTNFLLVQKNPLSNKKFAFSVLSNWKKNHNKCNVKFNFQYSKLTDNLMTAVSRDFWTIIQFLLHKNLVKLQVHWEKKYFFRKYFNPLCRAIEAQSPWPMVTGFRVFKPYYLLNCFDGLVVQNPVPDVITNLLWCPLLCQVSPRAGKYCKWIVSFVTQFHCLA